MSRTFIKEWVNRIDEDNFITHRLKNGKEKIITSNRRLIPFRLYEESITKPCYEYSIVDNEGKNFMVYVNSYNEKLIYFKQSKNDTSIVTTHYHYNEDNLLKSKEIKTVLKGSSNCETRTELYRYYNEGEFAHLDDLNKYHREASKLINELHFDNGKIFIMESIPSNTSYRKTTSKLEYEYILAYNSNIIRTKIHDEKVFGESNNPITESIEFTLDEFTYKIINYISKNKLKLIVKTNQKDELTLSERFFYDTENKDINYFSLFAAIALRGKTLLGIKEDDPVKYFFILLRDLEELVKFNFIKEEEIKEYEM